MTSRRDFLHVVALAGLPALASTAGFIAAGKRIPLDLAMVLVDGRHPEACALGACLTRSAVAVRTLADGDITQIWLREIGPAWRARPLAVAGLTARPALFCLEQLAFGHGLRVVLHGEHVIDAGGQVQHSLLRGARESHLSVRELVHAGPLWPERIAAAIAVHRQQAPACRVGPSEAALEPTVPAGARLLTSWIIAPV